MTHRLLADTHPEPAAPAGVFTTTGSTAPEPLLPETTRMDTTVAERSVAGQSLLMDDEHLARRLFDTDPEQGCSWLFRRYYAMLCNHALRFVYSREVAEDIVGEVFCNFWNEQTYRSVTTSYRAYLFRAVRYRAYNYLRWELTKQSDVEPTDAALPSAGSSPADLLQFDELYHTINQTIAGLPPQCRRVFLMSRFEQKSYRAIADELGISVKAVEANVSRALVVLRQVLRSELAVLLVTWLGFGLPI